MPSSEHARHVSSYLLDTTNALAVAVSDLASNNLLSHAQHGFVKQRSTCTNLLESVMIGQYLFRIRKQ